MATRGRWVNKWFGPNRRRGLTPKKVTFMYPVMTQTKKCIHEGHRAGVRGEVKQKGWVGGGGGGSRES